MGNSTLSVVVQFIHQASTALRCSQCNDQQLLERYLSERDEVAFAELVRRHGPMVFGVCRRALTRAQDAEDAFQATFLILSQKAHTVKSRETIGGWLYRVAFRVALRASTVLGQRNERETSLEEVSEPMSPEKSSWQEIAPLFDEELHRLPEKYLTALVLCDLEGITQKEAAQLVGCSEGTLSSRLYRGRQLLAKRLTKRGVCLGLGALVTLLSSHRASARMTHSLLARTAEGTANATFGSGLTSSLLTETSQFLARGVLQMMFRVSILKITGILTAICLLGTAAFIDQPIIVDTKEPNNKAKLPNKLPLKQDPLVTRQSKATSTGATSFNGKKVTWKITGETASSSGSTSGGVCTVRAVVNGTRHTITISQTQLQLNTEKFPLKGFTKAEIVIDNNDIKITVDGKVVFPPSGK